MKGKWAFVLLVFSLVMVPGIVKAQVTGTISSCQEIKFPGVYQFDSNITFSYETCITILSDDVVIDCDGHEIKGSRQRTSKLAFYVDGARVDNVTIRNCYIKVGWKGTAIKVIGSSGNKGVYIHDNFFYTNTYGVYLEVSMNTVIDNNVFQYAWPDDYADAAIYLSASSNNNITNNFIEYGSFGIYLDDGSNYNVLFNNTVSYFNRAGIRVLSASGNVLTDNILNSNYYGIYMNGSSDNIIVDSNISDSINYDVAIYTSAENNIFLNATYNSENVDSSSQLIRQWYLDVHAEDTSGADVRGANVSIENVSGDLLAYFLTNETGWIPRYNATEYINSNGRMTYWTDYTIRANKSGYENDSEEVRLLSNEIVNLNGMVSALPRIDSYTISPRICTNCPNVTLGVNVSDSKGVDSIWVSIELPNSTIENISLQNNTLMDYPVYIKGIHNITFYVNDTDGNAASNKSFFVVAMLTTSVKFNASVVDYNSSGLNSTLTVYSAGTADKVLSVQKDGGDFAGLGVQAGVYDFLFSVFGDTFNVLLKGINISQNIDKMITFDMLGSTYAVTTTYSIANAIVTMHYSESSFQNESFLGVYICENWNFTGRYCSGTWNKTPSTQTTQNTADDYFNINVSGFSAFEIRQEAYCGDGSCGADEGPDNCSADCECLTGETRRCDDTHFGNCAIGTESCISGSWVGCPGPTNEVCNQEDDDCDGIIDNVNGGDSVETTKCQCYDGGIPFPFEEICDDIDDNCNGDIDEGVTRPCGPNTTLGICTRGVSNCIAGGNWSVCNGAVFPAPEDCDNDLDDDCDGLKDYGDPDCQANEICGFGPVDEPCLCGDETFTTGYCCGGVWQGDECPEFPWLLLIIIGLVIIGGVAVFLVYSKLRHGMTWEDVEEKYSQSGPAQLLRRIMLKLRLSSE